MGTCMCMCRDQTFARSLQEDPAMKKWLHQLLAAIQTTGAPKQTKPDGQTVAPA